MRPRISSIILPATGSIRSAMDAIEMAPKRLPESAPAGIALVTDPNGTLAGVVSDGDIRRAVLADTDLSAPVATIMNRAPIAVRAGLTPVEMLRSVTAALASRGTPDSKIDRIIIVDGESRPIDVVSFFDLWRESEVGARRVCILGLGFVGLTLAVTVAEAGFEIFGIEPRQDVLASLGDGKPHFFEKNLDNLLKRHVNRRLHLAEQLDRPVADIYIISVGTPVDEANGNKVDYASIKAAAESVAKVLKVGDLVILRSTVPVGTTRDQVVPVLERLSSLLVGQDFSVAFAPERTVEGKALEELRTLPQVIGGYDERSLDLAARFFRHFAPTIVSASSLEGAEMVKLINNSYRDLIFGFANQVALLADRYRLPAYQIIAAANEGYPRDRIPQPSPGVGGICLRKDPLLFVESAQKVGLDLPLSTAARAVNRAIPERIAEKVVSHFAASGIDPATATVGFLGVAFKGKPETSDIRGSVTLDVAKSLRARGIAGIFLGHDPLVPDHELRAAGFEPVSIDRVFRDAHAVLLLTNHHAYQSLDFSALCADAKARLFFDGWNAFHPAAVEPFGLRYEAIGTDAKQS